MIFNCFYDEDMEYADVVYIPDEIGKKILRVQNEFFSWIFDKNNNHEYWIIVNGEKKRVDTERRLLLIGLMRFIGNKIMIKHI